jgi:hypothetical protein
MSNSSINQNFVNLSHNKRCMTNIYKKKALVGKISHNNNEMPKRIRRLCKQFLYDLDVYKLCEETSSDNLFVWMKKMNDSESKISSIQISDTQSAITLYNADRSLYFRAPPEMEQCFITEITKNLGMNFSAIFADTGAQKSEVEIFVSKAGHVTDWHFDYMENFTIQLQGSKKWKLCHTGIRHYSKYDTLEQQLKFHCSQEGNEHFVPYPTKKQLEDVVEITLNPGDIFYFPAGIFHRVECIEDSISINLSLVNSSWADLIGDSIKHLLLRDDNFRTNISNIQSVQDARAQTSKLLLCLKDKLDILIKNVDFLVPSKGLILEKDEYGKMEHHINLDNVQLETEFKLKDNFLRNPLCTLIEIPQEYLKEYQEDDNQKIFVLHFNFGNEEYTSMSRVQFQVPNDQQLLSALRFLRQQELSFNFGSIPANQKTHKLLQELIKYGYIKKI